MKHYTKDHEWIKIGDKQAQMGITTHATEALGDIVYVELPDPGRRVAKGETIAVVESVKAASDIYAPVGGIIEAVNEKIVDKPELLNQDPEESAWLVKLMQIEKEDTAHLMDAAAYAEHTKE